MTAFTTGAKVGYFSGDIRKLSDDIKVLRPTVVPAVPRVLNRVYDRVCRFVFCWHFASFGEILL